MDASKLSLLDISEPSLAILPDRSLTQNKPESVGSRVLEAEIKDKEVEKKPSVNLPLVMEEKHSNESDGKQDQPGILSAEKLSEPNDGFAAIKFQLGSEPSVKAQKNDCAMMEQEVNHRLVMSVELKRYS